MTSDAKPQDVSGEVESETSGLKGDANSQDENCESRLENYQQKNWKNPLKYGFIHSKGQPLCRYTIVPNGWIPPKHQTVVSQIFLGLGLETPDVFFSTIANKSNPLPLKSVGLREMKIVDTNNEKKPSKVECCDFRLDMEQRLQGFFNHLSESLPQIRGLYLLDLRWLDKKKLNDERYDDEKDDENSQLIEYMIMRSLASSDSPRAVGECNLWEGHFSKHAEDLKNNAVALETRVKNSVDMECGIHGETIDHLIFFEGQKERDMFYRKLYDNKRVGILSAGDCAFRSLEDQLRFLRKGTPLFLFRHTNKEAHCLVSLLKVLDKRKDKDDTEDSECKKPLENECYSRKKLNKEVSPRNDHNPYDVDPRSFHLVKNFLQASENDIITESSITIDVFDEKYKAAEMVSKVLDTVAMMYETARERGGTGALSEKQALNDANTLKHKLDIARAHEQLRATIVHLFILFVSLAVTILSCVYVSKRDTKDGESKGVEALTVILPILLTVLLAINTQFESVGRTSKLRLARSKLEREQYFYRCRIGMYRAKIREDGAIHRRNFASELEAILDYLNDKSITRYALGAMDWDQKRDDKWITQDESTRVNVSKRSNIITTTTGAAFDAHTKTLKIFATKIKHTKIATKIKNLLKIEDEDDDESPKERMKNAMGGDEYIERRIKPKFKELAADAKKFSFYLRFLQILSITLSSISAILSWRGLQLWNPVLLAFVAMFAALQEHFQLAKRIESSNVTMNRLLKARMRWNGLMHHQKIFDEKEPLVEEVEEALYNHIVAEMNAVMDAESKFQAANTHSEKKLKKVRQQSDDQMELLV